MARAEAACGVIPAEAAAEIAALRAQNARVDEVPWFRQNYLGEWVIEDDKRVYRFNPDRNVYGALPGLPSNGSATLVFTSPGDGQVEITCGPEGATQVGSSQFGDEIISHM